MKILKTLVGLLLCCLLWTGSVFAAERLQVGVNRSNIYYGGGVTQVAIANPEIADVVILSPEQYMLVGKKVGSTSLHVWKGEKYMTFEVVVNGTDPRHGIFHLPINWLSQRDCECVRWAHYAGGHGRKPIRKKSR